MKSICLNTGCIFDESGSHHYKSGQNAIKDRYLCLLGVIISEEENKNHFDPAWSELRHICTTDINPPPPLHYIDVLNKRNEFKKLEDDAVRAIFDKQYMQIISERDYTICCVVLDKETHFKQYEEMIMHPYHYCFNIMLGRYIMFLNKQGGVGDIVVEARGKREDRKMQEAYKDIYTNGTQLINSNEIKNHIKSHEIKFYKKKDLVSGIEFADMLATPMKHYVLSQYDKHTLSNNFSKQVLEKLHTHKKNYVISTRYKYSKGVRSKTTTIINKSAGIKADLLRCAARHPPSIRN